MMQTKMHELYTAKKKKHESVNMFSDFNISRECSYRKMGDKLANQIILK